MRAFWGATFAALSALACSSDDGPPVDVDCDTGAIPTFSEVTAFAEVCTNCHDSSLSGDARNGAPEGYNFDDYDSARDEAEHAAGEVSAGAMPPPESGFELTLAQKDELYRWALCGTPR